MSDKCAGKNFIRMAIGSKLIFFDFESTRFTEAAPSFEMIDGDADTVAAAVVVVEVVVVEVVVAVEVVVVVVVVIVVVVVAVAVVVAVVVDDDDVVVVDTSFNVVSSLVAGVEVTMALPLECLVSRSSSVRSVFCSSSSSACRFVSFLRSLIGISFLISACFSSKLL